MQGAPGDLAGRGQCGRSGTLRVCDRASPLRRTHPGPKRQSERTHLGYERGGST